MKEKDTYCVKVNEPASGDFIGQDFSKQHTENVHNKPSSRKFDFVNKVLSWRAVIVLLIHVSFVVNIIPKIGLSMALVCMVRIRSPTADDMNTTNVTWTHINQTVKQNEFDWDSGTRGLLLSGYQFVCFMGPAVSSLLKLKLDGKTSLTLVTLTSAVLSFISPVSARTSPYFLLGIVVVTGLTMGANVPVIGDTLAWWLPESEKLTWVAVAFAGVNTGSFISTLVSGFLCTVEVDNGWPFIFYFNGLLSVVWLLAWQVWSSNRPEDHPYITEQERAYIMEKRVGVGSKVKEKTPIYKLLKSVPVLAYVGSCACHIWVMQVTFSYLPVYLTAVLDVSIQETGMIFSGAAICRFVGIFLWTLLGNWLLARRCFSNSTVKKMCICGGFLMCSVLNVGISFFDNRTKGFAIALLMVDVISGSIDNCFLAGVPLDMAPRYAGAINGLNYSFGMLLGISAPLWVAKITPNNTHEEWRLVWLVNAVAYGLASGVFALLGQARLLSWSVDKPPTPANPASPTANTTSAVHESPAKVDTPVTHYIPEETDTPTSTDTSTTSEIPVTYDIPVTPDLSVTPDTSAANTTAVLLESPIPLYVSATLDTLETTAANTTALPLYASTTPDTLETTAANTTAVLLESPVPLYSSTTPNILETTAANTTAVKLDTPVTPDTLATRETTTHAIFDTLANPDTFDTPTLETYNQ